MPRLEPVRSSIRTSSLHEPSSHREFSTNTQVYDFWVTLNNTPGWTLGRAMISSSLAASAGSASGQSAGTFANTTSGFGNYNAAYVSLSMRDFKGVTRMQLQVRR